ncbi:hypothetical protein ED312_06695 [Sinomicrobium pectinilyticum]|uniref:Uncharacterized protein n=1 Tax=Sinomicrobium pectinilyticum TaxID=1084421 RepID=A0A3N0EQS9_SINP1|nr:hypothetical protein [Sinomicrobium pectinilyticum]RNL90107.1 hypothetical protein ED312_06695 [Sinomicrobium pectinilyticum]
MRILICLVGITWIAISCNTENDLDYNNNSIEKEQTTPGENSNTSYLVGRIYREILDRHSEHDTEPSNIEEVNKEVQALMQRYKLNEAGSTYTSYKEVTKSNSTLDSILANAPLSPPAKQSFTDFIYTLVDSTFQNHGAWEAFILSYENEVTQQLEWPEADRDTILTATSLIRETGNILRGGREDEDWDIAIGNIVMILIGVFESTQAAIVNALMYTLN